MHWCHKVNFDWVQTASTVLLCHTYRQQFLFMQKRCHLADNNFTRARNIQSFSGIVL